MMLKRFCQSSWFRLFGSTNSLTDYHESMTECENFILIHNKMEVTNQIGFYRRSYLVGTHRQETSLIPLRNNQVGSQYFDVEFFPQV